ncbi:hypothetical protein DNI36_25230 [Shigella sonnei]|nr:hypothetical protein [Shigella sonnei]
MLINQSINQLLYNCIAGKRQINASINSKNGSYFGTVWFFLFLTGGYLFIFFLILFYVIFIKMGCELLTLN